MATNVKGFVKSFIPGVTTDAMENEGAVAIFLGGLIGTGAAVHGHLQEGKTRKKAIDEYTKRYADLFTGDVGKTALNLFQDSVSSIYKQNGKKKITQDDKEIEVRNFAMKDGNLEMDPKALLNITLGQLRNKQLWNAEMVAAYRNDPMMAEYNKKMALASMVHDIYSKGYSKEEATKYLETLKSVGTEEAKTTGVDTFINENMDLAKSYLDTLDDIHTKNASKADLEKNPQEFKFNSFLKKINFYLAIKKDALEKMSLANTDNDTLYKLLEDTNNLINDINTDREGVKNEYLDTVNDIDNHLKVVAELKDKKNLTPEEQEKLDVASYKIGEFRHVEGDYALVHRTTSTLSASLTPYQLSQINPGSRDYFDSAIGRQQLALEDATNSLDVKEDPTKIASHIVNNVVSQNEQTDEIVERTNTALQEEDANLRKQSDDIENTVRFLHDDLLFSEAEPNDTLGDAIGIDRVNEFRDVLSKFNVDENTPIVNVPVAAIIKEVEPSLIKLAQKVGKQTAAVKAASEKLSTLQDKVNSYSEDESNYRNSSDKGEWLRNNYFKLFTEAQVNTLIKLFEGNKETFDDLSEVTRVLGLLTKAKAVFKEGPKASFVNESIEYIQKTIFPAILDNIKKQGEMQLQSNSNITRNITDVLSNVKDDRILTALEIANESNPESLDGILIAVQSLRGSKEFSDDLAKQLSETLLEYEAFLKDNDIGSTLTSGTFKGSSYYAQSPYTYINIVLAGAFPKQFNDQDSKLFQFKFDQDFDRLILELNSHNEFSDSEKKQLIKIWTLHNKVVSINYISDILNSSVDFNNILDRKEGAIGDIKPSLQQNIVLNTLLTFLASKDRSQSTFANWALVKGLGGSGKTFVVGRLLAKLSTKSLYAFSKTTKTSENINRAIFDNPPASTFESFMSLSDTELAKLDVIIVDEAFTFTNMEIETIRDKINIYNNTAATKIKVIALGDPSQVTAEEIPLLSSTMALGITSTLPLTATYRTNVGPISSVNTRFRLNNTTITDAFGQASKSSSEALDSGIADVVGVMVTKDEDELFKILALPSSRSRVLIVNDENERSSYKGRGYDVETPLTAQGYQWDEVYMLVDKDKLGKSNFEINRALYTGLSRAKSLIVTAPNLGIKESLPNKDLVTSSNESSEQLAQATQFFNTLIEGAKKVKSFLQNGVPSTVHSIVLDEEESEAAGSEDIAAPTSYLAILDEDLEDDNPIILPRGDEEGETHTLSYPSNYPLSGNAKISINSKAHVIRILNSKNLPSYAVVAQSNVSPNYVLVAVLGDKDFGRNNYFSSLIDKKPGIQFSGVRVNKLAEGFNIPNIEQLSLGEVAIEDFRKFKVMYSPNYDTSETVVDNAIKTFYKDYFGINKSGTRVIPAEAWDGTNAIPEKE